jgi:hypothetical protein
MTIKYSAEKNKEPAMITIDKYIQWDRREISTTTLSK